MLRTHFRCFWKISFSPRSLLLDYSYSRFCFISLLYHEKKEERKIFTILFSPIRIYIHTRYGKKTTRLPSPLPLRIIKPCICHRSEPVSVPRNRNRCLTHSTKESVSSSRGPKQSFSNPIFQPNRGIDSIRVVSRFTRFEKFVRNGFRLDSKNSFSKRLPVFTFPPKRVSGLYTPLHRSFSSSFSADLPAIRVHSRLRPSELSRERGRDDELCQYNCPRVSQIRG